MTTATTTHPKVEEQTGSCTWPMTAAPAHASSVLPYSTCVLTTKLDTHRDLTLRALREAARPAHIVSPQEVLAAVIRQFDQTQCAGALVIENDRLVGVLSREAVAAQLARPFFREIYRDKPLSRLLGDWEIAPLELSESVHISAAIGAALARPAVRRYEPIVSLAEDGHRRLIDLYSVFIAQCRLMSDMVTELEQQREAILAAQREREQLHERLMNASREAGRAEVATGVLHNVGNVLNSVNVSASLMEKTLRQSKVSSLDKAVALMKEHDTDLNSFLTSDERGKHLPGYLVKLTEVLNIENETLLREMDDMSRSIEHIKQVVQMQQSHAKPSAVLEPVHPEHLMEDALRVNLTSFDRHRVQIERNFEKVPAILIDKHKVLQILINVISNAKNAVRENQRERRITVSLRQQVRENGQPFLEFTITDNGVGIPSENLTRIFTHGFTTRRDGHGFGLHSAANSAREIGGSLTAHSDGLAQGATFTLTVPVNQQ